MEAEADQTTSVSSPELLADGNEIDKDAVQNPAKKDALTEVSSRFGIVVTVFSNRFVPDTRPRARVGCSNI